MRAFHKRSIEYKQIDSFLRALRKTDFTDADTENDGTTFTKTYWEYNDMISDSVY